ncbi:hypothetical protein [Polaribacter sp. SA4-12]|uniref:hypothetical protein n=1 Tax=Polaribacter sp. SA4-12 TaxID=1312072 RepID=UPI000B3C77D5|nr:hypothetical protein [Polaribacter sp. SA4-12]ARV15067.1 hypothetical protein BTO07_07840 [Polaribacter sp. SA4-12]
MNFKIQKTSPKRVLLKSYIDFQSIEIVLKIIKEYKNKNLQISVIGKFHQKKLNNVENPVTLENRYKKLFESSEGFEILSNPEIGTIFITGFLGALFSEEVELKKIGSMPTGPFGILRGLGIDKEKVTHFINILNKGNYLLVIRGNENELTSIEDHLNILEKVYI